METVVSVLYGLLLSMRRMVYSVNINPPASITKNFFAFYLK